MTYTAVEEEFNGDGYTRELSEEQRIKVSIENEYHYIGLISLTETTATIEVSSIPQEATLNIGEIKKFEVTDDNYYDIYVKLESISNDKATITAKFMHEEIPVSQNDTDEEGIGDLITTEDESKERNLTWLWIALGIIVILLIVFFFIKSNK